MRIVRSLAAGFLYLLAAWPACFLAAAPASADPALWVAHKGTATVYLFGTIHVLPAGTQWMNRSVLTALGASEEVWTEADISSLSDSIAAIRHYGLRAAHPTEDLLPAAYHARYEQQVAQSGMPAALFEQAQPWLVEILLSAAAMQHSGTMGLGVEASLMRYAADHHLATPTFETLDTQFAMLADLPLDAQLASLEEQIDEFDLAGQQFAELLSAWRSGDDVTLDRLTNQDMRKHSQIVWTELILRRNELFVQKIEERLQGTGTFFVAVGAAHLCGDTGVPALLRAHGVKVDRVK
jgi:uncharacterized protein YbaP (TraB family)